LNVQLHLEFHLKGCVPTAFEVNPPFRLGTGSPSCHELGRKRKYSCKVNRIFIDN
jgi:hypothetical protein